VRASDRDDGTVALAVTDTGVGIPPDKVSIIFDPFVQVHRDHTRPREGTGLGLAISRDLARGMRGDLLVSSTIGSGSTFTLSLPRVQMES
jgi:signal transduction histidine kinase